MALRKAIHDNIAKAVNSKSEYCTISIGNHLAIISVKFIDIPRYYDVSYVIHLKVPETVVCNNNELKLTVFVTKTITYFIEKVPRRGLSSKHASTSIEILFYCLGQNSEENK